MIEIDLKKVIREAEKEIFYQRLAELIYKKVLESKGW